MMKVLVCVRKISAGGAETLESRLAVELNRIGIEADILSQYSLGYLDSTADAEYWKGKGVHDILWLEANSSSRIPLAVMRLVKLIKRHKYAYVITSNTGLDTIAALARIFVNFKHVVALHDYPHESVTGSRRFKMWKSLIVRKLFKAYSISEFVKRENLKYLSIAPDKIENIYNSIDRESFEKEHLTDPVVIQKLSAIKGKKLLFIGRLVKRKGIDTLLELLAQLPGHVSLVIAGDSFEKALEEGAANYRDEIMSMIDKHQLQSRVVLLGQCKGIYDIMRQCDVMVHLPKHEGFGLVLLEAFAAHLPIVTVNVGGIPEVIKDTGYKAIDPNDEDALLAEINRMLNLNDAELKQITDLAYDKLDYFSDKRRAKEIASKIFI